MTFNRTCHSLQQATIVVRPPLRSTHTNSVAMRHTTSWLMLLFIAMKIICQSTTWSRPVATGPTEKQHNGDYDGHELIWPAALINVMITANTIEFSCPSKMMPFGVSGMSRPTPLTDCNQYPLLFFIAAWCWQFPKIKGWRGANVQKLTDHVSKTSFCGSDRCLVRSTQQSVTCKLLFCHAWFAFAP